MESSRVDVRRRSTIRELSRRLATCRIALLVGLIDR